jgi:hypothetical protein
MTASNGQPIQQVGCIPINSCQSALNIDPLSAPKIDPGVGGLCR